MSLSLVDSPHQGRLILPKKQPQIYHQMGHSYLTLRAQLHIQTEVHLQCELHGRRTPVRLANAELDKSR